MAKSKDPHAVALGRKGGQARARTLPPVRLSAIARLGAQAMWKKRKARISP